jgi:hypothetical protein
MRLRHSYLGLLVSCLIASCGEGELLEGVFKAEESDKATYPEFCEREIPADLSAKIARANQDNSIARASAVAAEQTRLGVSPLKPTHVLEGYTNGMPTVDPFPNSVVAVGDPTYDIRKNGYQITHGMMEQFKVYETERGSGKFFIVDLLIGDGLGSKDTSTDAATIAYGLNEAPTIVGSWHSWHVNGNNLLVRAKQETEDTILSEISVCGCGNLKETDRNADYSSDSKTRGDTRDAQAGIFMLPASTLPTFSGDEFKARFQRSHVKIRYVPRDGRHCRSDRVQVAC